MSIHKSLPPIYLNEQSKAKQASDTVILILTLILILALISILVSALHSS